MTERRGPLPGVSLLLAFILSLALALTVVFLPNAPWRIPLALLGGIWAPGHALLALAYPRGHLSQLERHALSACAGLCLVPLLALLSSETVGLTSARLALVATAATLALGGGAWLRARRSPTPAPPEPLTRTLLPSTRTTLALCGAALVLAAAVEATSVLTATPEPASLSMSFPEGPLRLNLKVGEVATLVVDARAGAQRAEGELVVTWENETLHREPIALGPREARAIEVPLPTDRRGERDLTVTWLDLRTDATFRIGGA